MKKSGLVFLPLFLLAALLFASGVFVRRNVAIAESGRTEGILWAGAPRLFGLGEGNMEPQDVFKSVLLALESDYVEKIGDKKKLTYGAIESMVEALNDPYSQFLTPARRKSVEEAEQGQFHGLGAIVLLQRAKHKDLTYERLMVANVLPGSPAEKAGLVPGDVIARIEGRYFIQIPNDVLMEDVDPESIRELFPLAKEDDDRPLLTYKEVLDLLSADGKTVGLTVLHPDNPKTVELKVTLGPTKVPAVESRMAEPGVGYVALRGLTRNSANEVKAAVDRLKGEGATSMIVDLRDSFGGPIREAQQVAALFTRGPLGYVVRQKTPKQPLNIANPTPFEGRVVVLINRATLGASELLASALAEHLKAPVVGAPTFGDGLDQTLIPLADGSAIQLTTGKFLTSAGVDFHQKGIKPTNPVVGPPARQLETALTLAKAPGGAGA